MSIHVEDVYWEKIGDAMKDMSIEEAEKFANEHGYSFYIEDVV